MSTNTKQLQNAILRRLLFLVSCVSIGAAGGFCLYAFGLALLPTHTLHFFLLPLRFFNSFPLINFTLCSALWGMMISVASIFCHDILWPAIKEMASFIKFRFFPVIQTYDTPNEATATAVAVADTEFYASQIKLINQAANNIIETQNNIEQMTGFKQLILAYINFISQIDQKKKTHSFEYLIKIAQESQVVINLKSKNLRLENSNIHNTLLFARQILINHYASNALSNNDPQLTILGQLNAGILIIKEVLDHRGDLLEHISISLEADNNGYYNTLTLNALNALHELCYQHYAKATLQQIKNYIITRSESQTNPWKLGIWGSAAALQTKAGTQYELPRPMATIYSTITTADMTHSSIITTLAEISQLSDPERHTNPYYFSSYRRTSDDTLSTLQEYHNLIQRSELIDLRP